MQASVDAIRVRRPAHRSSLIAKCFAVFTLVLLGGYALFGKGFAYIGIPPYAYVGELGLFLALVTLCTMIALELWRCSITWLVVAFMLWGFVRTIPYIGEYGIDALRDGVTWGYGIYALAVATVMLRFNAFDKVANLYGRALPVFLILAPTFFALYLFGNDYIPRWPWGPEEGVPIIFPKAGDLAAQYAGAFPFIALGLSETALTIPMIALWILGIGPIAAYSRGALVTIAASVGLVTLFRPTVRSFYSLSIAAACLLAVFLALSAGNIGINTERDRSLTFGQIVENLESIVSNDVRPDLEGTKQWRQKWWDIIIDYTVHGEYFWTGKGFGINLADDDGFSLGEDHFLRSPHSIHMTILARMGVPGLAIWVALQISFLLNLVFNFWRDCRLNHRLAAIELWILIYWLAFLINGSFDVFLEGPQGGIWFWSIFGFGLALIAGHRRLVKRPARSDAHLASAMFRGQS